MKYQILLFTCLLILVIVPGLGSAVKIDSVTLALQENNDGEVTLAYHLTDRDSSLLAGQKNETLELAKTTLGLQADGTGTHKFTIPNMTQWVDNNGTKRLLLHGFYFTQFDWRKNEPAVAQYPVLGLLAPDFKPSKLTIVWPTGEKGEYENVTYVPNMMLDTNISTS